MLTTTPKRVVNTLSILKNIITSVNHRNPISKIILLKTFFFTEVQYFLMETFSHRSRIEQFYVLLILSVKKMYAPSLNMEGAIRVCNSEVSFPLALINDFPTNPQVSAEYNIHVCFWPTNHLNVHIRCMLHQLYSR